MATNAALQLSRIFVSYTMRDGLLSHRILEAIEEGLSPYGRVFIDALHNIAAKRQECVIEELLGASAVVLVSTPGAACSPWVQLELALATAGRIPIFGQVVPGAFGWRAHNNGPAFVDCLSWCRGQREPDRWGVGTTFAAGSSVRTELVSKNTAALSMSAEFTRAFGVCAARLC